MTEALQQAINARDAAAVVRSLRGLDEARRAECHASIEAQMAGKYGWADDFPILCLARFGTAPDVAAISEGDYGQNLRSAWTLIDQDAAYQIFLDRNPQWLADLAPQLPPGRLTRQLIAAGRGAAPPEERAASRLISAYGSYQWQPPLEQTLLADPELLEGEIFLIFSSGEWGSRLALEDGMFDRPHVWGHRQGKAPAPERTWRATLTRLARAGQIDIDRLIAGCLSVFMKDFRVTDLTWFAGLHAELKPTVDETRPHASTYMRLLAAEASFGVGLAQKALTGLVAADAVEPAAVIEASAAPLTRREKTLVVGQLKLLDAIARKHPSLKSDAVAQMTLALEHERTDVQEVALRLIAEHGGVADGASVDPGLLSPVLAAEAKAAGLPTEARRAELNVSIDADRLRAEAASLPSATAERFGIAAAIDALDRGEVAPTAAFGPCAARPAPPAVTDVDELIELMSEVLEHPGDALGVERVLAGAARTAQLPQVERARLGASVAKRAEQLLRSEDIYFYTPPVSKSVAAVVYSWTTGWVVPRERAADPDSALSQHWAYYPPAYPPRRLTGVLIARADECTRLIAQARPAQLLAEPTRTNGVLDAEALLERVERANRDKHARALPIDLDVAALRLHRDVDDTFWRTFRRLNKKAAAEIHTRWLASGPVELVPAAVVVPPRDRWLKRDNEVAGEAHLHRPVTRTGTVWPLITDQRRDPDAGIFYQDLFWQGAEHAAGWALLAPWHPELVAGTLLRCLSAAMYPSMTVAPEAARMLGILIEGTASLGPVGHLTLALGLLGDSADVRAAAGDAIAAIVATGRLDPAMLASALVMLADAGAMKLNRVIDAIRHPATDPLVGFRLLETFTTALPDLAAAEVRDLHLLLARCSELAARFGTPPTDAVNGIASRRGSSRLVIEARRLASLSGKPGPERPVATVAALDALLRQAREYAVPPLQH